ncbi:unnamed protein product [Symbiodinium necroappetens]|uniref:Nitronate monooxygenase n=1 Tax=Symbiodinium necroappetens TaxID=1628268 RepID=A0A812VSS2_9DINO|nr:unnamed protein product [Symbiodinium necroappetens]
MGRQPAPERLDLGRVSNGFLYFDWFAIPQITARQAGTNEDITKSDAARAVRSIPAYVEAAELFIAAVPGSRHSSTGAECNYLSWMSRGWCRAELWCHVLSNKADTSLIVVKSAKDVQYMLSVELHRNLIADGKFTVEADRASVMEIGEVALNSKISHLSSLGRMTTYRYYVANREKFLSTPKKLWDESTFLHQFRFGSLSSAACERRGMNGLMCAVLAGDANMVRTLVRLGADVNQRVCGLAEFGYFDGETVIMAAVKAHPSADMLSLLIELKAEVQKPASNGLTTAALVQSPEQVHVLAGAKADLDRGAHPMFLRPLTGVATRASAETVAAMLSARCNPNPELGGIGHGPLHSLSIVAHTNADAAETTRLLLAHRADVNAQIRPRGRYRLLCAAARAACMVHGFKNSSTTIRVFASFSGLTPLGGAALSGCETVAQILLEAGAKPIANDRGDTPEDLAAASQHEGVQCILSTVSCVHTTFPVRFVRAQEAGVDLIEIVGYEGSIAGGQPGDEVGAWVLLAKATSMLKVPVIAAGASGTGRQLAAALAMGAQGITMATRFLCTVEAPIDQKVKETLMSPEMDERSTTIVLGTLSNATRVFKNGVSKKIREIEGQGDVDFSQVMPLASGSRTKKMWQETGDTEDAMWSCSQSIGLISDIPTCQDLLKRIVAEAEERLSVGMRCIVASKL